MPVKIVMPVPDGYDVDSVSLYHIHDGEVSEVEIARGADNKVTFMTDRFSTFIFAQNGTQTDPGTDGGNGGQTGTTDSGSSSDDSGSYTPNEPEDSGFWTAPAGGTGTATAAIRSTPGDTYPTRARMDWYHFNADGYITTGWFTDTDGHIYYLNPVSNGFMGAHGHRLAADRRHLVLLPYGSGRTPRHAVRQYDDAGRVIWWMKRDSGSRNLRSI